LIESLPNGIILRGKFPDELPPIRE
jgi:hypothetical protein